MAEAKHQKYNTIGSIPIRGTRMRSICIFIASLFVLTTVAEAKKRYLNKGVTSFTQYPMSKKIHGKNKPEVLEGCGPIAAAMVLGYWQTQRGQSNLLSRTFNGTAHPTRAIQRLYQTLKTKSAPGKNNRAAFTLPDDFYNGLKKWVAGRKLEVKRMRHINPFNKKADELKKQIRAGNPVMILKSKEHKDGCIGEESKGWNIYKNISDSHYFVVVGYQGNKVAVMPGWAESPKSDSMNWNAYAKTADVDARRLCTFDQLKKDGISLFWIQKSNTAWCKKDSDCGQGNWCNKGFLGIGKNKCQAKLSNGKKCSRDGHCQSGECKGFKCVKMTDQCKKDKDCGSGKWCDKGTLGVGKNVCKLKLANGKKCTRDGHCKSGECKGFKCVKMTDQCKKDKDCGKGKWCDKGTLGVGKNVCKSKYNKGTKCVRKGQCKSNKCSFFKCK